MRGSADERVYFRDLALSRDGKISNPYSSFPNFRELSRSVNRLDCVMRMRDSTVSILDFDLKREPIVDGGESVIVDGYEIFGFETRAWSSVLHYDKARSIAKHIQNHRPGNPSETGCLRTHKDWSTWLRRYRSRGHRRVRTAGGAFLSEIVASHKAGLVDVSILSSRSLKLSEKLNWLSSLGFGDFSRYQWDNLSKKSRRESVISDADLDEIRDFVKSLEAGEFE